MSLGGLDASSSTITVEPNGKRKFTLSANAKGAQDGVYEGEVLLENADYPSLHLPFVIHVGEDADNKTIIQNVKPSNNIVYSDAPVDITATLKSNHKNPLTWLRCYIWIRR